MTAEKHDRLFKRRVVWSVGVVVFLQLILLVQIFDLQVKEQASYQTLSEENRLRVASVPPTRGLVYDRNGFALARNRTLYHLEVTPIMVDDIDRALGELAEVISLSDDEIADYKRRASKHKPFHGLRLKSKLSEQEVAKFAVNRYRFPGVDIVSGLARVYPYAESFSHVIGYLGAPSREDLHTLPRSERFNIRQFGKSGIERFYEEKLRGKTGIRKEEVNVEGRVLRAFGEREPVAGKDLLLTLDKDLQMAAYEALGDYEGAVVALDPRDGAVLAMVSKPAFNPNQFIGGISREMYRKLLADDNNVFFNRALSGQYAPGSTIKPLVALAGLKHRVASPDHYMHAGPYYVVPGYERKFRDWRKEGHGWVNLRDSIAQSCDVFFYDLSYRLGIDRMSGFFREFGLGEIAHIDIHNEMPGLVPTRSWKREHLQQAWYPEETVNIGIGQSYLLATPLQLAVMTATIAARGKQMQPHLIRATRAKNDKSWQFAAASKLRNIDLAPQHWDYVIESMIDAVHRPNGTAYRIGHSAPYTMAGKTGTVQIHQINRDEEHDANKVVEKRLRDHALFIAFAPVDNPTIAVAVIVEHVGGGSKYAAPIARRLLDRHFGVWETAAAVSIPQG